ncbi:MAG: M23 family metallopeptidase [Cyanothece sp. SIO1E1]|nr:M23 family metallopeptidase [Cyanothece sp. SIO1E1]
MPSSSHRTDAVKSGYTNAEPTTVSPTAASPAAEQASNELLDDSISTTASELSTPGVGNTRPEQAADGEVVVDGEIVVNEDATEPVSQVEVDIVPRSRKERLEAKLAEVVAREKLLKEARLRQNLVASAISHAESGQFGHARKIAQHPALQLEVQNNVLTRIAELEAESLRIQRPVVAQLPSVKFPIARLSPVPAAPVAWPGQRGQHQSCPSKPEQAILAQAEGGANKAAESEQLKGIGQQPPAPLVRSGRLPFDDHPLAQIGQQPLAPLISAALPTASEPSSWVLKQPAPASAQPLANCLDAEHLLLSATSGGQQTRNWPTTYASGQSTIGMSFPLAALAPITSRFGWRVHPIRGDYRFHEGLDLGAPMGTPVLAALPGRVTTAEYLGGYGLTVMIEHGGTTQRTLYGHLSGIAVQPGTTVEQGAVIGWVGSTGLSTGPHLHFETHQRTADGWVAVDPLSVPEVSVNQLTPQPK